MQINNNEWNLGHCEGGIFIQMKWHPKNPLSVLIRSVIIVIGARSLGAQEALDSGGDTQLKLAEMNWDECHVQKNTLSR